MLARSALSRGPSQLLVRAAPSSRRGLAAAATAAATVAATPATSQPLNYTVGETAGVKFASRDDGRPTTTLAVVARGGSRYEVSPGLAHGLEKFAFKNTKKRSALRLQREAELLGGSLGTTLSRENIVLRARFLREDLPYFVEALAEVISLTKYTPYEFNEEVGPTMGYEVEGLHHSPAALALETAHDVAFHKGLGSTRLALTNKYLTNKSITAYASEVYNKGNIAVIASGAPHSALEKWISEFLSEVPPGTGLPTTPAKYYGGENRIYSTHGDALVIAFPGSPSFPSFKAEYYVLSYLLGGETAVKWNAGLSVLSQAVSDIPYTAAVAKHVAYTDAGLLYITITGPGSQLTAAGKKVVEAFKSLATVKPEDLKKAITLAKFNALAAAEDRSAELEAVGQSVLASGEAPLVRETVNAIEAVTAETIKEAVNRYLEGKATFVAVGELHLLPHADELGLKV